MRISSAVLFLALAACSRQPADTVLAANGVPTAEAPASSAERVDCALAGAASFANTCTIERTETDAGLVLTVRNPDNGFHRLQVVSDGRGVIAADGAEAARVSVIGDGRIEVAIGGDRYRLPATVKAKAG
jgi:hypothetical protein